MAKQFMMTILLFCFNDLTILQNAGKDSRHYKLVECRCNLCGSIDKYRESYVLTGRVKRCKSCNKELKIVKIDCASCGNIFEKRNMHKSKRFGGYLCSTCYENISVVKCKECDNMVDVSNGNHSGYCEVHWNLHRIAYNLLSSCKHRAKKAAIDFDLDVEWIKSRLTACEVTGINFNYRNVKIKQSQGNYIDRNPLTPSIDKIDPNKGYTKDNCRVVIWWYNLAKATWNDSDILGIVKQWMSNKGV